MSFLANFSAAVPNSPRFTAFLSTKHSKGSRTFSFRNKKLSLVRSKPRNNLGSKERQPRGDSLETHTKTVRKFKLVKNRSERSTPRSKLSSSSQRSLALKEQRVIGHKPNRSASGKKPIRKALSKAFLANYVTKAQPKSQEDVVKEQIEAAIQSLRVVKQLPAVDPHELKAKRVVLPKTDKKTVIFDLDETLVHCCDENERADIHLPIRLPNEVTILAGINIRPHAKTLLQEMKELYEVIVFTASHQCYADAVLDYLDPNGTLIDFRLYRDSCVFVNGMLLKDLRILGNRRLENVMIVDNTVHCFGYQLNNGIPIISWTSDKQDKELVKLREYLKSLVSVKDVRVINQSTFKLEACLLSSSL